MPDDLSDAGSDAVGLGGGAPASEDGRGASPAGTGASHPPPPPLPPFEDEGPPIPLPSGGKAVRLREMRVGEMLDAAIHLYRARWKTFAGIVAFVLVPFQFLESFLTREVVNPFTPEGTRAASEAPTSAEVISVVFTVLLFLFVVPFITAAVARATSEVYLGGDPSVRDTYRFALSRTHSILWVTLLSGLAVGFGFLLLLVPGFLFLARFTFGPVVVVVEGLRGTKAMRRSWRLAKGQFWKIVGTLVLAGILTSVVGGILQLPLTLVSLPLGAAGWVLRAVGGSLAEVATRPFSGLVGVLLYFDMRIRKEGFDLALMAQEMASGRADG